MNTFYNTLHNRISDLRDRYTPTRHTSTFRETGQITPEEFVHAGDFLVYKFPSWSWSDASHPSKRLNFLPDNKQFLVTRGVPCHRRLNENFAGDAGVEDQLIKDALGGGGSDDDDGWLRTGAAGMAESQEQRAKEVRTVDEGGKLAELPEDDDEEIPDMEDEEDDEEAIIRDTRPGADPRGNTRNYNIYITYSSYWRTPRLYLSGYNTQSEPLPPPAMMDDIVGDYSDKTVTLDDFPYTDAGIKMASIHPCKHASVMKVLLDRADAALKLRMARVKEAKAKGQPADAAVGGTTGMEGLIDDMNSMKVAGQGEQRGREGEEWEVLESGQEDDEVAIRVDQYLIVFLKFVASVTPGIEHDYTMGI